MSFVSNSLAEMQVSQYVQGHCSQQKLRISYLAKLHLLFSAHKTLLAFERSRIVNAVSKLEQTVFLVTKYTQIEQIQIELLNLHLRSL